jgi:Na+-transporting methylmalonyl-CoA/oxaloacetate decarboxylase gamma subunit
MARKPPSKEKKMVVYGICAVISVIAIVVLAMTISSSYSKSSFNSFEQKTPQATQPTQEVAQQQPQAQKQVVDTDVATVEYRGTQDAMGNAVISFAFTNKTDARVVVAAENIVVNDQFDVQSLTGSMTPIGPGNTGAVGITFGVPTQTTLAGVSDLRTISADLVMLEDEHPTNRVAVVPVTFQV